MKTRNKIIIALIIIFIAAVGIGTYLYFMPQKDYAAAKADYKIDVADLFNAFDTDEPAANQKYVTTNCVVQVSGILKEVITEQDLTTSVVLTSSTDDEAQLTCNLVKGAAAPNQSQINQTITVQGQCTGFQGLIDKSVYMMRGAVVN